MPPNWKQYTCFKQTENRLNWSMVMGKGSVRNTYINLGLFEIFVDYFNERITCTPRLIPSGMLVSPWRIGIELIPRMTSPSVVRCTRSKWMRAEAWYVTMATWSKCRPSSSGGPASSRRKDFISSTLSTPGGCSSRMLLDVSTTRTMSSTQ